MKSNISQKPKPIIIIMALIFIIGILVFASAKRFSNEVSVCSAEDNENTAGTFADSCDATDGSLLEFNDGTVETHAYSKNKFAGVRIQSVNTSVKNCGTIQEVFICYEYWGESGDTLTTCDVSVDANGGASYTAINSTCPGTTANPGLSCTNVTTSETWNCQSFFGASGTRALAKSELTRSNAGPGSTASWDVLYFNVSYSLDTTAPSVKIKEPQNITYTTTSLEVNYTATDSGSGLESCFFTDNSGTTNTTLPSCLNKTFTASQGTSVLRLYVNDTANNLNKSQTVTYFVDSVLPTIQYTTENHIDGFNVSAGAIFVNVSVNETNFDSITFFLHNSSGQINSTKYTTAIYEINFSGLIDGTYTYNVTVNDSLNNQNTSLTRTLILDSTIPGFILNSPENKSIDDANDRILNATIEDNKNGISVKIFGADETTFDDNNSLVYKRTGLANLSEVTYNWTSPVLNVTSDTLLLMHFDLEHPDNDSRAYDETGINNGTKISIGGPAWNESGKFGYALGFDSTDDYLSINDSDELDLIKDFSISFWTFPTNLTNNQTFLAKGSGTTVNYYIDFKNRTESEIEFGFYNGAFRSLSVNATSIFVQDKWNHIVAVWNETSNISRVYINNQDKGSLAINHDILANNLDLKVGHFPGYTQNFTGLIDELAIYNKTLNSSEVEKMYHLKNGDWNWRIEVNDSASNLNVSVIRSFTIGTIWGLSTTDLGSIGGSLNTNTSLGTITINNTHETKNISINITHDFDGLIVFNDTLPRTLNGTAINVSYVTLQINATVPATVGSTTITFNVTADDANGGGNSVPASKTFEATLVSSQDQPFLISDFETVPTTVSQNNSGVELKASVVNRGQGDAQSVVITFILPNGWSNSTGALSSSDLGVNVNAQKNYSITVDINSSATAGIVVLEANLSGKNDTGTILSSNLITVGTANVTVNAITAGAGPSSSTDSTSSGGGGGGGGGSGGSTTTGGHLESVAFKEAIEIIRGPEGEAVFDISITPRFEGTALEDLTLTISGFPRQFMTIDPSLIRKINYKETQKFTITLKAPSYKSFEEHDLTATIKGTITRENRPPNRYLDTRTIKLFIQEIALSPAQDLIAEAEKAISLMKEKGFNTIESEAILEKAKQKLDERKNKESYDLAQNILDIKELAFDADDLIRRTIAAIENPRRTNLIVGNVIRNFGSYDTETPLNQLLTGNSIFASESITDTVGIAVSAFDRGDYETAYERIQSAQLLLILERKGSFGLFLYLYWYFIILAIAIFSVATLLSYRGYQKSNISRKIEDINVKEGNIGKLIAKNQKTYFSGKISAGEYHRIMHQHENQLSKIRKERLNLRNRRIKILKPQEVSKDLKLELMEIESTTKKIQEDYYIKKKLPESTYKILFNGLNERMAEIEGERATIHLLENRTKNKRRKNKK